MVTAVFVAVAALLALATFAWVLHPLLRTLPASAMAAVVALAVGAGLLYRLVGAPAALEVRPDRAPESMPEAIVRLEGELRRDPGQAEGWRLLGRAYQQQGDAIKARDRFGRAARLAPGDADVLVEAAEARALAYPDRRFDAAAIDLLQRALRVQPMHQRGRWFLGIALRQAGRNAEAASTWEPLLAVIAPATATALRPQIDAARQDAGLPPLATAPPSAHAITVKVALDPAFAARARLSAGASVFVIARVPNGPPMPVAVQKHALSELPLTVTLDDADGPMPMQKLSALGEVEVLARVSASGNAVSQPGDVASKPVRVALPTKDSIDIVLGQAPRP